MKTYTVELTASEIEALQICLCAEENILEQDIRQLEYHNASGIHSHKIELKRRCISTCAMLWNKLYRAEND